MKYQKKIFAFVAATYWLIGGSVFKRYIGILYRCGRCVHPETRHHASFVNFGLAAFVNHTMARRSCVILCQHQKDDIKLMSQRITNGKIRSTNNLTYIVRSCITKCFTKRIIHLTVTRCICSTIDNTLGHLTNPRPTISLVLRITRVVPEASFKIPLLSICIGHSIADIILWNSAVKQIDTVCRTVTDAGAACAVIAAPWVLPLVLIPTEWPEHTWHPFSLVRLILAACVRSTKTKCPLVSLYRQRQRTKLSCRLNMWQEERETTY